MRRRLAELSPRDRGVVEAMAVIGEGAAPHVVSRVAGVPVGELGPARDALQRPACSGRAASASRTA